MTDDEEDELVLGVWAALRALEGAVQGLLALAPADPKRPELWVEYNARRQRLDAPALELGVALRAALPDPRARPGESLAERTWAALLIHYDERELANASQRPAGPREPLLQTKHCNLYDGGELFFVYLEDALRSPATPSLVLQLFLFCLRAGFCGRYSSATDPGREALHEELCQRVVKSDAASGALAAVTPQAVPIAGVRFPWSVYALAFAFVVGFWFALESMAETHQASRAGLTCVD